MRSAGWTAPVRPRPWEDIAAQYDGYGDYAETVRQIIDSIIAAGETQRLVAFTSMLDLMVLAAPLGEAPHEIIAVRPQDDGGVLIEHLSVTGHNDRIERPADEAVALFWRFVIEKFGITPNR